jgi:hypothetical protein
MRVGCVCSLQNARSFINFNAVPVCGPGELIV